MPDIFLGLDYSKNKIGIATGQSLTHTASALKTIKGIQQESDWTILDDIVSQWKPAAIIIGLPLNMDGSEQSTSKKVRHFAQIVKQRYTIPTHLIDERLTSREASHILGFDGNTSPIAGQHKKKKKKQQYGEQIDSMAAQLILQSWLNENQS